MSGPVSLRDFIRWFQRHGIKIEPCGSGSHYKLSGIVDGHRRIYIIATESGRRVKHVYVDKARKTFKLTQADGVSDQDFFV